MKKMLMTGVVLVAGLAMADKVEFKSGSFLTGTAGAIQGGKLVFTSDDLGELKIDIAGIKSLEPAKSHVVQYADGRSEAKILTVRDGALCNAEGPLDMAGVKATDPGEETWHGNVNVGLNIARGNTYQNSATVVANVNRRWDKDRLNADFGYYYGESAQSGEATHKDNDRIELEVKHDHFWWEKVYNYENAKFERDMMQDLRARYRLGLGGGYQWLENRVFDSTGKWSFNQELGINWIKEEFDGESDAKKNGFAALRYAHKLDYIPKWYDNVAFFHNFEYLPEVDEWEKYLIKADIGFTTKLVLDFDLLAKIEWDYNSCPAGSRKESDVRYIVGLGYKW